MADRLRRRLSLKLIVRSVNINLPYRHLRPSDADALSSLMLDAYRGSIDDDGETLADAQSSVRATFSGEHGDPLLDCSFLALDAGRPISVTLVTMFHGEPLLAQVYTAPQWKRRGVARALVSLSVNALIERGEHVLNLVVTAGNEPAERVYDELGFTPIDSGEPPPRFDAAEPEEASKLRLHEVLDRTRPMMALAESVDAATPGAAGLAYQAAELAVHVLMMEVDGSDPWDDEKRYRRACEVLEIRADDHDLPFMHLVRLRDFYANAASVTTESGLAWGPPLELPSADDCRRCVLMARRVVDAVHAKIGRSEGQ